MRPPNKGMKQTKPAQAMELRSLSLVFARLGPALPTNGGARRLGADWVGSSACKACDSVDRALRLRGTSPAISASTDGRRRATLPTRRPSGLHAALRIHHGASAWPGPVKAGGQTGSCPPMSDKPDAVLQQGGSRRELLTDLGCSGAHLGATIATELSP